MLMFASLLCTLLNACTDRRPAPTTEPYIIRHDGGGQIISAEADRAMLAAWGGRVEIRNHCYSACVIFLTLPNACIGRRTEIGFHGSSVNVGPIGNQQIARYLRGEIKRRYLAEWQYIPTTDIHIISAPEYVRMDPKAKLCEFAK